MKTGNLPRKYSTVKIKLFNDTETTSIQACRMETVIGNSKIIDSPYLLDIKPLGDYWKMSYFHYSLHQHFTKLSYMEKKSWYDSDNVVQI